MKQYNTGLVIRGRPLATLPIFFRRLYLMLLTGEERNCLMLLPGERRRFLMVRGEGV